MISKIIIIGNYRSDKQYSMQIFEQLMAEGYKKSNFIVNVIRPNEIIRKFAFNKISLMKWMGYIDKFILFPIYLVMIQISDFIMSKQTNYHICDHSNAIYLYFLPKKHTLITCHDVLAIKAGLGFSDTYCSTTKSGVFLQKIILNALSGANKLVAVSEFTLSQLKQIDKKPNFSKNWKCIHNALAEKFVPMQKFDIQETLKSFKLPKNKSIILHVGSDLERKNRKLLIYMIYELQKDWDGILVFAGEKLNNELIGLIKRLNISHKIIEINNLNDKEIIALYSYCEAMIFPSYSEGFGWPIIEAQACGAPVITSAKAPMMTEVGGNAALYADPNLASDFITQFLKLSNKTFRNETISRGYQNSKRFDFDNTMRQYVELIKN